MYVVWGRDPKLPCDSRVAAHKHDSWDPLPAGFEQSVKPGDALAQIGRSHARYTLRALRSGLVSSRFAQQATEPRAPTPIPTPAHTPASLPETAPKATPKGTRAHPPRQGRRYGRKRESLVKMRSFPQELQKTCVIATDIAPDWYDYGPFRESGWRFVPTSQVRRNVSAYLRFIADSWGEIGIAKEGYVVSRGGWMSDRSVV